MLIDNRGIQRFFKYSIVGGSTFAFDLLLLFLLVDGFGWNPVGSSALAFIIAVSVNYTLSRRFVFPGSIRSSRSGYTLFLFIAGGGLLIISGLMAFFTGVLGWNYLVSRILVAFATGFCNYLLNLYVNFSVAGQHDTEAEKESGTFSDEK